MKKWMIGAAAFVSIFALACGDTKPAAGTEKFSTAQSGLIVRKGPSATAEKLGMISYGTAVKVLGEGDKEETIAGKTGRWARISFKGGEAWVFGGFLADAKPAPRAAADRIATAINLENADTACNVEMEFEKGVREIWPADFAICEKLSKGKRFRFKTEKSKVIAASCQGDPECKESKEVDLIVSVEIVK